MKEMTKEEAFKSVDKLLKSEKLSNKEAVALRTVLNVAKTTDTLADDINSALDSELAKFYPVNNQMRVKGDESRNYNVGDAMYFDTSSTAVKIREVVNRSVQCAIVRGEEYDGTVEETDRNCSDM